MKEINYWEEFTKTGNIEDYLSFKNCDTEMVTRDAEDESYARFSNGNRNSNQNDADR